MFSMYSIFSLIKSLQQFQFTDSVVSKPLGSFDCPSAIISQKGPNVAAATTSE
jgi:hypothetical protein